MLSAYLSSIFIFAVIILCVMMLCFDKIKNNGWLNDTKDGTVAKGIVMWLCVSAIPVFRILFIVAAFYMSFYTKEHLDKQHEELKVSNDEDIDHDN